MVTSTLDRIQQAKDTSEDIIDDARETPFESSFTYHAVPLDEQATLDDNGTPFTLKELMDLHELHEELEN